MKRRGIYRIPLFLLARVALLVGLGLTFSSVAVVAYATDFLDAIEGETVDARFAVRGTRGPPRDLVMVKIDDLTFQELASNWPFPRTDHAKVIDRIARDGPRVIVYNVQFSEPSEREADDIALLEAIVNTNGKMVIATTEVNERGQGVFFGQPELLADLEARFGNGLLPNDPGGVLRRVSYSVDGLESLAVAATEVAEGRQLHPGEFGTDGAWIDYYGPTDTIPGVSFSRVLHGKIEKRFFRDKVVVVGATAPSLQDMHQTSTSGDDPMSGTEIHATAIDTLGRGLPLRVLPVLDVILILAFGLLAPLASLRLTLLPLFGVIVGVAAALIVAAQLAFAAGVIVGVVYPLAALAAASVAVIPTSYVLGAFDRAQDLFSRFVPAQIVEQVLGSRGDPAPGGVSVEGTVMFSDLRGFTRFAESLSPERVIEVLNRYLAEMGDAILAHGGTVVSYMGDGIMAVFGAPGERHDHADRAVAAAREMVDQRLPRFNQWLRSQAPGQSFRIGVGLNSGPLTSGFVGSSQRLEYAVIGDTTNTAARLEAMTKGTPHQIFIADTTRSMLVNEPPDLSFVGELELRGRERRVKVWSLSAETRSPGAVAPDPLSQPLLAENPICPPESGFRTRE